MQHKGVFSFDYYFTHFATMLSCVVETLTTDELVGLVEKTLSDMLRGTIGEPALDGNVKVAELIADAKEKFKILTEKLQKKLENT